MSDYPRETRDCERPVYDTFWKPAACGACHACTEGLEIDAHAPTAETASLIDERDADADGETVARVNQGLEISHDDALRLAHRGDVFERDESAATDPARDKWADDFIARRSAWAALESEAAVYLGRALRS